MYIHSITGYYKMKESLISFRVDEDLKKAFEKIAKEQDITSSQLLRMFMRDTIENYMKQNRQGDLLKGK